MKIFLLSAILLLFSLNILSQEISETDTDKIYVQALEEYQARNYKGSLKLTDRGLELAPGYHDIRILHIRNLWALENYIIADEHLDYLLTEAPAYPDVLPLVHQRINRFQQDEEALKYLDRVIAIYPADRHLQVKKAGLFLQNDLRKDARKLAVELLSEKGLSGADRYALQLILNRTVTDEIGVNYQYINFSDDYSRTDPWHSISADYQHNFNRTAVIARINYTNRAYANATLYELEAYPVFNDKFYAMANIGVSNGSLFPDVRSSLSFFYNFAQIFEAETGGRIMFFNDNSYFTGILGLTVYSGKFYLNARTFLGPERGDEIIQNYQGNVRYYLSNADNYLFLRVGSGISPDERVLSTQVIENPLLEAFYANLGINTSLGYHHIFQLGAGILYEDITPERHGNQFLATAGYRYRF